MAGNSGYVDFTGTNYSSTQTLRVYWQETVTDAPGATSTVAITKVQLASESYIGSQYYGTFQILVNGQAVITCDIEDGNAVYLTEFNTFYDVKRGGNQLTGSVGGIAHDAKGNATINITLQKNPNTEIVYAGFWRMGAHFEFTKTSVSKAIALHQIPVGTLSISAGTGSTVSVTRSGTVLSAGANLWYGQSLVITFGASTGYTLNAHTVNGSTFTSGGTHTVTGNVAVVATATRSISTISTGNGTFGVAQTITVTRYISTAKHTIYATCAGQNQTIVTKGTALSVSWTPAVSIMNSITTAMSASCKLTINTYDANDNYLGASSITITLALPTSGTYSVKPTPTITDSDANGYYSTFGGYVARKSALSVAIQDGLKYSATMASRSTSANGVSSGASSFNAGTLTQNTTISTTVKDSRGQTGTASKSISVLAYTSPSITTFSVRRTNASGTADDTGDYFTVSWAAAVTALNNRNTRSLTLRYKRVSASTWSSQTITMSAYSASGTTAAIAASGDYSWDVQLVLSDYFETVTKATKLSTAAVVESRYPDGKGVAFGKVAETNGLFDVKWNAKVRGVLAIGDNEKVRIFEDGEGGNIEIYPPDSAQTVYTRWQMDALTGTFRLVAFPTGGNPYQAVALTSIGALQNLGISIGQAVQDFDDYGSTYNGNSVQIYADVIYTYYGGNRFRMQLSGKCVPAASTSTAYNMILKSKVISAINSKFGKSYTTISGFIGHWTSDPALSLSNQGYGRVLQSAGDGTTWGFGRRYTTSGSVGNWGHSYFYNSGNGTMVDVDMYLYLS